MTTQEGRVKLPVVRNSQLKTQDSSPESIKNLEEEVKASSLRRQLAEEQRLTNSIVNPQSPDPPIQISGKLNLGEFDMQAQAREAREQAEASRKEVQERLDAANSTVLDLQGKLHSAELNAVRDSLQTQIAILTNAVKKGQEQPNLLVQLQGIEALAQQLGFSKDKVSPETEDWNAKAMFLRLQAQIDRENREFVRAQENDRREWDLRMKEFDLRTQQELARLRNEENKIGMLAAIPAQFGTAFAQGVMARSTGGPAADAAVSKQPKPVNQQDTRQPIPISALYGEDGVFDCPICKTDVGLAPTAVKTTCPGCNQVFTVNRVEPEEVEEGEEVPSGAPEPEKWRPI